MQRLIDRLPRRLRPVVRRCYASRWLRVPLGLLLAAGGLLAILPFFGLWMLPLGLLVLSEDVPGLRRARGRLLDCIERRRPAWFADADGKPDRGTKSRSAGS
jgi:hypothetical protein